MGFPPWSTAEEIPCDDVAFGGGGFEASVDIEMVGLSGSTQIIVAASKDDREVLLPRHGALLTDGLDSSVLVTFEVDATPVIDELNPTAGVVVTLSGDRSELGSWSGHAIALRDDGAGFDEHAGDAIWPPSSASSIPEQSSTSTS